MNRKYLFFVVFALLLSAGTYFLARGHSSHSGVSILLIGMDGASIDILDHLASENKIPNLQQLMENGAVGHLDSLMWKKKVSGSHGYFSPIVWSSIATGKTPDKHGVEDFLLPLPSTVQYRMGSKSDVGSSQSVLQYPFHTRDNVTLSIQARAPGQIKNLQLQINLNDRQIGSCELTDKYIEHHFKIPAEQVRWSENRIAFRYSLTQRMGDNLIAADVESIRLFDSDGQQMLDYHPSHNGSLFLSGWIPQASLEIAQASSFHLRTRTLWEIASKFNKKIGVVGWWATWPAFPVNGYLVSSQTGLQGERRIHIRSENESHLDVIPDLTYPADYVQQIKPLHTPIVQMTEDFNRRFFELGKCGCVGKTQEHIVMERFWQDAFFSRITQDLMSKHTDLDLTAVYFRGTDTISHQFLAFADNPEWLKKACEGKEGCDLNQLKSIVDNYYIFVDAQIGELLKRRRSNTITFVVTDHGEVSMGVKGTHKNNGFIIAQGPGIRKHTFQNANVLDITPTLLYLLNLPVAQDMDGKVLMEVFQKELFKGKPVAYIDSYDKIVPPTVKKIEVNQGLEEQNTEELKALGYLN
jgi:predicted AlkP superfamily phosphohydrolase/phosphomutase